MARPAEALTYTVAEAAAAVGIDRTYMYDLISRGDIPSLQIGRRRLIAKVALEQWVADNFDATLAPRTNHNEPAGTQPAGS